MRCAQCAGDLYTVIEDLAHAKAMVSDGILQTPACDVLHCNEIDSITLVYLVNDYDVGVIQGRCGSRLPSNPQFRLVAGNLSRQKQLYCDCPLQAQVLRLVDPAHSASPKHFLYLVV